MLKISKDVLLNDRYLYGNKEENTEYAMKGAAHELLGASQYWNILSKQYPDFVVPMQTLIDFMGFRIVAIPVLPLSQQTILYGSSNAGIDVFQGDSKIIEALSCAAKQLHLAEHFVRGKLMYSAADMEVHRLHTASGEDYYCLIDMARCFPPEMPNRIGISNPGFVFFRMLRPELLQILKLKNVVEPLSSDSLTGWGRQESDIFESRLTKATNFLFQTQMRELCSYLYSNPSSTDNLSSVFHLLGVNMRHLGSVLAWTLCSEQYLMGKLHVDSILEVELNYHVLSNPILVDNIQHFLLIEIIFRTMKNMVRSCLRGANFFKSEEKIMKTSILIKNFFGLHQQNSELFEKFASEIEYRYGKISATAFREYSKHPNFSQIIAFSLLKMLDRCGIVLSRNCLESIEQISPRNNQGLIEFRKQIPSNIVGIIAITDNDIIDHHCTVKKLPFLDIIFAQVEIKKADFFQLEGFDKQAVLKYRDSAIKYLDSALSCDPHNEELIQMRYLQLIDSIGYDTEIKRFGLKLVHVLSHYLSYKLEFLKLIFLSVLRSELQDWMNSGTLNELTSVGLLKLPQFFYIPVAMKLSKLGIRVSKVAKISVLNVIDSFLNTSGSRTLWDILSVYTFHRYCKETDGANVSGLENWKNYIIEEYIDNLIQIQMLPTREIICCVFLLLSFFDLKEWYRNPQVVKTYLPLLVENVTVLLELVNTAQETDPEFEIYRILYKVSKPRDFINILITPSLFFKKDLSESELNGKSLVWCLFEYLRISFQWTLPEDISKEIESFKLSESAFDLIFHCTTLSESFKHAVLTLSSK